MTWRELLIGCVVACALTLLSVIATRGVSASPQGTSTAASRAAVE